MASSSRSGYVPSVHHPEVMRSILAGIVETGDVIGTAGLAARGGRQLLIEELAGPGTGPYGSRLRRRRVVMAAT